MSEPELEEETVEALADLWDLSTDEVRARIRQHGVLERLQERAREERVRWVEDFDEDWLEYGGEG